ncbi:uncharacterized protein LOC5522303 isoform X2 [Nematostella vectensis]|uniref:uncharacterized protein LOC5522303 isoform X2 n=1 Tax=Nematostella vectensis TaxID=45351 RepID=UPI00138FEFAD|nr:uncharacterized protein LOC5522303 isoform X2 [Nematostella vectensis]
MHGASCQHVKDICPLTGYQMLNRGRLASKCGIPPTSPRSRKRDAVKSLSCWSHEELADSATGHRHYSTSDIECLARQAASNGLHFKERRDSSSSTTSDGSETQEENPFSPVKRARSASPEADEKHQIYKRRTSDSTPLAFFPSNPGGEGLHGYDTRAISMHREINARYLMTGDRGLHSQEGPVDPKDKGPRGEDKGTPRAEGSSEARSAFRAVHQDVAMSEVTNEALQRDMAIRAAKLHKQPPPSPGRNPAQYLPTFSHPMGATSLISPTHSSPRLPPDPLLLAGHPSGIYHPALRGVGYASMHQLQQNLMQYRLLAPPGTHNPTQSPLAGLALQNKLYMHDTGAMAANTTSSAQAQRQHENGLSPKRRRLSAESSESGRRQSIAISDETNEKRECEQMNGDRTNHVSVIHRSPNHSPISIDEPAESTSSASAKDRVSPHKLIPKLRLDLDQDILAWGVDDVCKFILSLTGVPEVVAEFREHSIDGQSLILLQEEHLLNRMGIKLGPALKIKAHIRKILEKLQSSQENNDSTEST